MRKLIVVNQSLKFHAIDLGNFIVRTGKEGWSMRDGSIFGMAFAPGFHHCWWYVKDGVAIDRASFRLLVLFVAFELMIILGNMDVIP